MSKKVIFGSALVLLFLLTSLFFPISSDLAIFLFGGKLIAEGGKIFVDFIDLKPPLIYYFFALIYKIAGYSEIGIRLFDLFWQLSTCLSIYALMRKSGFEKLASYFAVVVYAISYTALNFNQTMQIESFCGLLIIWIILLQKNSEKRPVLFPLIAGLLIGLLAGSKYTLLAVYPALLIDDILDRKMPAKRIIFKNLLNIGSIAVGLGLASLPLLDGEIRHGFFNILTYLNYYASLPPLNMAFLRTGLKQTAVFFGDNYSILLVAALAIAVVSSFRSGNIDNEIKSNSFLRFSFMMVLFLFFTVAVEKKFGEYHFSRMYVPLSILSGFGLKLIFDRISGWWKTSGIYSRVNLVIVIIICLIFSPFPRWLGLAQLPITYAINKVKYNSFYEREEGSALHRKQHLAVACYVNSLNSKGEKVIVMSTGACVIHHFLNTTNISRFAQSQYYFGSFRIPEWDNMIMQELTQAKYVVVQTNDRHPNIYGHNMSSSEALFKEKEMYNYLLANFKLEKEIGYFQIYRRNLRN